MVKVRGWVRVKGGRVGVRDKGRARVFRVIGCGGWVKGEGWVRG